MIQLKNPLCWDGHLIPEGTIICLPAELEQRLVSAGNAAEFESAREAEVEPAKAPTPTENSADAEPSEAAADPELQLGRGTPRI